MKQGTIRVEDTKNKKPITIYMNEELLKEMRQVQSNRRLGCAYVFHRDGRPIRKFEKSWKKACIEAGLYKIVKDEDGNEEKVHAKIYHDFRRTAVRNFVRSGIPERVAMQKTGHKTRSVFDRYNIVNDQDLIEAKEKEDRFNEKLKQNELKTVTVLGTVSNISNSTY